MLDDQQILSDLHVLPPEKQAEVLDFIAFVKARKSQAQLESSEAAKPFAIRPAIKPSGTQFTARDHDAVFTEAAQDQIP